MAWNRGTGAMSPLERNHIRLKTTARWWREAKDPLVREQAMDKIDQLLDTHLDLIRKTTGD